MTTAEEKMFQEAVSAIESGNRSRGKDLLTRLLKQNQENPDYWLWMSGVVDSVKERRYCLNQTLKLDPQNKLARRGLIMLGDLPVDESLAIPFEAAKTQMATTSPRTRGKTSSKSSLDKSRHFLRWPGGCDGIDCYGFSI